jgi:hypothetical protein
MNHENMTAMILKAIERAPDWLRQDLTSNEHPVRLRAEETLAAIIASALKSETSS